MIGSDKYKLSKSGENYYNALMDHLKGIKYTHIVNPCGEISIHAKGGYCIISDLVPYFADTLDEAKEVARATVRFLIRTNLMNALYSDETKRTNRIGVGLTAIHEFAWKFFGFGFRDLINESKSQKFWSFIEALRITSEEEAHWYSKELGVNVPHTTTTIKPSGSVSKLFALTEGAHLPAMRYYLRWVQLQNTDPLLKEYRRKGYPIRLLNSYPNVSIVGFPTVPLISTLGMGDALVTAPEATPEEQYVWLRLLEKYWLGEGNNQISYTLKFDVDKYSLEEFRLYILANQGDVRCCAVMPTVSQVKQRTLYEYLPEEEVTYKQFASIVYNINDPEMTQQIDMETLQCVGGACPL